MPKLREELKAKGLPTDDEACVLHAMFPNEFAALHKAPAKPAAAASATPAAKPTAPSEPATTAPAGPSTHLRLSVNGRDHDVRVEELS